MIHREPMTIPFIKEGSFPGKRCCVPAMVSLPLPFLCLTACVLSLCWEQDAFQHRTWPVPHGGHLQPPGLLRACQCPSAPVLRPPCLPRVRDYNTSCMSVCAKEDSTALSSDPHSGSRRSSPPTRPSAPPSPPAASSTPKSS